MTVLMIPPEQQMTVLKDWLLQDEWRLQIMKTVAQLNLPQGCVAAGFVRNLIWDHLHGYKTATPLDDIDVIYFDPNATESERDIHYEVQLKQLLPARWSVKNQARMHMRNHHSPYVSTADAMRHWVEVETAAGAYWQPLEEEAGNTGHSSIRQGDIEIVAPFGLTANFAGSITFNTVAPNRIAFKERMSRKRWKTLWPELIIKHDGDGYNILSDPCGV
ncbi:hypothetical protein LMG33818_001233 [Halomonadaceae bacterium LMG 33818]